MYFPVANITVSPAIPFLVAVAISTLTSMGGVSGAFVLLPFQVSVLGFAGPAVTPTNHLFNVIAIPSGVYRYVREGRMLWPLSAIVIVGTVPGVVVGSLLRIYLLPDPRNFKLFVGMVLLWIGTRLLTNLAKRKAAPAPSAASDFKVRTLRFDFWRLDYEFCGQRHGVSTLKLALLTAVVGLVGGAYGVGGGAIIAPVLVSVWRLPVHSIAGATLLGTCVTSVVGVCFFALFGPWLGRGPVSPDWALGLLFGLGGLTGMYLGARLQKRVPARAIEAVLAVLVLGLAVNYGVGFVRR